METEAIPASGSARARAQASEMRKVLGQSPLAYLERNPPPKRAANLRPDPPARIRQPAQPWKLVGRRNLRLNPGKPLTRIATRDRLALAEDPYETSDEYFREILQLRLAAGELAIKASQSAMLHTGAKGYLSTAPAQRKLRESYFVAIVTPATKHLRKELDAAA